MIASHVPEISKFNDSLGGGGGDRHFHRNEKIALSKIQGSIIQVSIRVKKFYAAMLGCVRAQHPIKIYPRQGRGKEEIADPGRSIGGIDRPRLDGRLYTSHEGC